MARLIITEEEKRAATFLEWDDAAVGKAVKALAASILDTRGDVSMEWYASACALISLAAKCDSAVSTFTLKKVVFGDSKEPIGDWQIQVKRLPAAGVMRIAGTTWWSVK